MPGILVTFKGKVNKYRDVNAVNLVAAFFKLWEVSQDNNQTKKIEITCEAIDTETKKPPGKPRGCIYSYFKQVLFNSGSS